MARTPRRDELEAAARRFAGIRAEPGMPSLARAARRARRASTATVGPATSRGPLPFGQVPGGNLPRKPRKPRLRNVDGAYALPPVMGGRQTQPANYNPFGLQGWYFIPKRQYQEIDVEELDVTQFTADQLLAVLPDLNPDFSLAVWNYLRTCGTDIEFEAVTPTGQEFPAAQKVLDDLVLGLNPQFGGMAAIIRALLLSVYLQGAACCEAAPTKNLKDLEDIYLVNPDSVWFQRDALQKLVPFQRQYIWGNLSAAYPYRMMNEETFFYVPVDPMIDDPYGRAPAAPALQVVFGLVAMLRDLQRVMHQHGYPRVDISLILEKLEALMPTEMQENEAEKFAFMTARMQEVVAAYNSMAPEDAFIHWDFVGVGENKESTGRASGGVRSFEPAAMIAVFRDQLVVALKSLPIFHGGGGGKGETETYGTVEYEIYTSACMELRDLAAQVLTRALTVALQFRGVQALVRHEWAPIRATHRQQDAMAEALEIENEVNKRDQGWTTQDDASNAVTGSDAVGPAPEPSPVPLAPLAAFPQKAPKGAGAFPPEAKAGEDDATPGSKAGAGEPGRGRRRRVRPEAIVRSGPGMGLVYAMKAAQREVERMVELYERG